MPAKDALTRFSDRVEEYVRYRPGYPVQVVEALRENCDLTERSIIADIGSGPGNLAHLFCQNGNPVYAVEPNREMRAAGERLLGDYTSYSSVEGTAERTTLPDASVDFVTAGQAFHWFDWPRAKTEFRRILRPGGWAVLIWNERLTDTTPFLRDYEALLLEYGTDYAQVRHERSYENIQAFYAGQFSEAEFENRQLVNFDGLRGRLLSSSYVPAADHPRRQPMLRDLQKLFDRHNKEGKVSIDYAVKMYFGHLE